MTEAAISCFFEKGPEIQPAVQPSYKGAFGEPQQEKLYLRTENFYKRSALEYWQEELCNKAEGTRYCYQRYFSDFLNFLGMTADQVLEQRIQDTASQDRRIQKRFESLFRQFLAEEKKKSYAPLTLQTIYASIRSFFEIHEYPLVMRKSDYPKGDSNGAKRATKEQIFKALNFTARKKPTTTALIMALKDSGLSVSDLRLLKCDLLLDNPNADMIPIQRLRKKTNLSIKTFIGEEAITALKTYFEKRRKGSRFVEPETITKESPLFRTWTKGKVKPMSRTGMSTLVRNAFIESGTRKVSAHSLRRFLQTQMEEANVNVNWIDQMLGHELVNCRGAYSKPTDEQLETAYRKGYDHIRIYPKIQSAPKEPEKPQTQATDTGLDVQEARTLEEVKALLAKGYKYADTFNGIKLYTK